MHCSVLGMHLPIDAVLCQLESKDAKGSGRQCWLFSCHICTLFSDTHTCRHSHLKMGWYSLIGIDSAKLSSRADDVIEMPKKYCIFVYCKHLWFWIVMLNWPNIACLISPLCVTLSDLCCYLVTKISLYGTVRECKTTIIFCWDWWIFASYNLMSHVCKILYFSPLCTQTYSFKSY